VIDEEGFRANVGIVICNKQGSLLWAKRIGQDAWQFPQGGIKPGESLEDALYRELNEEVGLQEQHVKILHQTEDWLRYRLPRNFIRRHSLPVCICQKQKWFLLGLEVAEQEIDLARSTQPEFDAWRWVEYWHPLSEVIDFKREVYRQALQELEQPLHLYLQE
jgi:putative (di)nucleoside polyphosphate hydrolase